MAAAAGLVLKVKLGGGEAWAALGGSSGVCRLPALRGVSDLPLLPHPRGPRRPRYSPPYSPPGAAAEYDGGETGDQAGQGEGAGTMSEGKGRAGSKLVKMRGQEGPGGVSKLVKVRG